MVRTVSTVDVLLVFASVIVAGAVWRAATVMLHDKPIGQAMALAY